MRPERVEDVLGREDLERPARPPEHVLDEEGEGRDVVHVGVGHEDGADARLLLERERVGEGARIEADRPFTRNDVCRWHGV